MCTSPAATRGNSSVLPSVFEERQAARIEAAGQELDADPQAPREALAQPPAVLRSCCGSGVRPARGSQIEQTSVEGVLEIRALEPVAALGAGAPRAADQTAHRAIARPIGCQHHELEPIGAVELRADDQRQLVALGGDVRAHHARERAFIGERERAIAQALGLGDQFLGLRSAAQKEKLLKACSSAYMPPPQANTPCRYQHLERRS